MKALRWMNDKFEESLLLFFLVVMTVAMSAQIVARYVFANPLTWSEELARFCFVWSGFLSISYCFQKQISIKIDQLVGALPKRAQAILRIFEKLIMLAFYFYMIPFSWDYFMRAIASGQLSPALQIPMSIIQVAPLAGFALSVMRLVQSMGIEVHILLTGKEPESHKGPEPQAADTLL